MGPRCSSAETQICHRSYIIAARHDPMLLPKFPFILSNFNFCPLAWHFCTEKNSKMLEKVQERALRFVYEDYNSSYEELLHIAKVPSLQIRRIRTMALETFKIVNEIAPVCLQNLVSVKKF